mgnify:CR=1 FL=1
MTSSLLIYIRGKNIGKPGLYVCIFYFLGFANSIFALTRWPLVWHSLHWTWVDFSCIVWSSDLHYSTYTWIRLQLLIWIRLQLLIHKCLVLTFDCSYLIIHSHLGNAFTWSMCVRLLLLVSFWSQWEFFWHYGCSEFSATTCFCLY